MELHNPTFTTAPKWLTNCLNTNLKLYKALFHFQSSDFYFSLKAAEAHFQDNLSKATDKAK